ncbi:uncharacterized protein LOC133190582 [Saccostrea echinata]|uniref:uncharacterized protein LOC133190582 n=1 Tax=Saccostrea echinata TaxID=191078 RepID=UPI002A804DE9|nr:uncharacterized protein LOC133190582 [Saccostrea echinata]
MRTLLLVLSFLGVLSITYAGRCFTDAECGTGECCFRHEGPMIMSKRQELASLISSSHGVCERYQLEGEYCSVFDKLNGHCSCGAGLKCAFVPDSTTVQTKRSMIAPSVPGSYRCIPIF